MSEGGAYLSRLFSLFSSAPFILNRLHSSEMREALDRRLRQGGYDLVICDVFAALNLPATGIPVAINGLNAEHLILLRYVNHEWNPIKKFYAWLEAIKLRRFEVRMYSRADLAIACSNQDANIFREFCPEVQFSVLPNVVDLGEYEVSHVEDSQDEDPSAIIHVGGLDWFPNRDSLEYFVRDIFPLVQRECSSIRLIVAGRNPSPELRGRFSHMTAIEFTGTVPDLRPVIAEAAVSVIPLRIGSGTRMKILEGGAMGKAMVSTSVGAEGLDFVPGKEILIADTPEQFAASIVELLRDPVRRRSLGEAARRRVVANYDLRALERSIEVAVNTLKSSSAIAVTIGSS
jgi:glycosyltransferase involved in cell wall biosynthesis